MSELCRDLKLSIWREDDPEEQDRERIRVKLVDELEMTEVEICYGINQTTHQSRRFHIKEAVVIALRQLVSEAFRVGLITDSLGEWKVTMPKKAKADEGFDVDLDDALL